MYEDRGGFSGGGGESVPVNVGDEFEVTIEAVGAKGDGIAKKEGFVLFVPGVQKGDNVKIRVTKVLRKVGFAEVVGSSEGGEEKPAEEAAPAEETSDTQEAPQEEAKEEAAPEEAPKDSEDFGEEEKK